MFPYSSSVRVLVGATARCRLNRRSGMNRTRSSSTNSTCCAFTSSSSRGTCITRLYSYSLNRRTVSPVSSRVSITFFTSHCTTGKMLM